MLKLSFSTLGCPQLNASQVNAAARKYGFAGFEIRVLEGESNLTKVAVFSPKQLSATKKVMTAGGIEVIAVNSGVHFSYADSDERNNQLKLGKDYIDIAEGLGAPYVRLFGGYINRFNDRSEVYRWIQAGFSALADYAAPKGVKLFIETHDDFSLSGECLNLLRILPKNSLYILWDILHTYRWGESFEDTWKQIGPYIKHVHLKDSAKFSRDDFDLVLLGEGNLPVNEAVEILKRNGYQGYLSFEWEKFWHPEIPDFKVAFPHFIEKMLQN